MKPTAHWLNFALVASTCLAAINPKLRDHEWSAYWVTHPTAPPSSYGVFHFRKHLTLAEKPASFVVHVSADNRYRLHCNGNYVVSGPQQSDLRNWRFETVDLGPFLNQGDNVLAAVVWNGGEHRPMAQTSHRTGFLLQGDSSLEEKANTDSSWKVIADEAYQPVDYRDNDARLRHQYYVAGALERLNARLYPWGWEGKDYDDSAWQPAQSIDRAAPWGIESHQKWQLVPRSVSTLPETAQRFRRVARSAGITPSEAFVLGSSPVTIPPRTDCSILLDQGELTTGYPILQTSKGSGSEIHISYAEALLDKQGRKGNRDDIEGKRIVGVNDIFLPDGGLHRRFQPLWTRSFRWVQIDIRTGVEPLNLEDASSLLTSYPAKRTALFDSDRPVLGHIWDVAWRTLALSAQDTFVSDLYWERIQYIGDTRLQALGWLAVTGDDRLVRLALEQFDQSRAPFGLTQSRYPADLEQYTSLYSLVWINMVHDYWMQRPDEGFVRQFLPGIAQVLDWYERQRNSEGMIPALFHLDFVDSDYGGRWKEIVEKEDRPGMTIHTLFYVMALEDAARLFEDAGKKYEAGLYRQRAEQCRRAVLDRCYDTERRLFADSPRQRFFSQHANILAILSDALPQPQQAGLLERLLADRTLLPVELYFRFYLGRALKKAGRGDLYVDMLQPWETMLAHGMTTFGEIADEPRSECHPWSSTPAYELLATVAGIEPASPGFRSVRIAPSLGRLSRVSARMPHPLGAIEVSAERRGERGLEGSVVLPEGLRGVFVWNGQEIPIAGRQRIRF